MDIAGLPVTLLDTAGIRETEDIVESLGIERAKQKAQDADLCVFLIEGTELPPFEPRSDDIILKAKADITGSGISGKTGEGVDLLISKIADILSHRSLGVGAAINARPRCI